MATAPYVGNNDYRGYLAYQAQTDPNSLASTALNLVGNDGGYDPNKLAQYAAGPGGNDQASIDALKNYISGTYNTFNSFGVGGGTAAPDLSVYDQGIGQVNSALGRLQGQQDVGNQNILSGYQTAFDQLQQAKALQDQSHTQQVTGNTQNYRGAKNTIDSNTGNSINNLQRLLGSRGAGGSSAALYNVPQAAVQQGTQQRAGAGQTYAQNAQGIDTNWNQYLQGYNQDVSNLGTQKTNSQNTLAASIASTRANLLNSLATLTGQKTAASGGNATAAAQPYLDQANQYLSQADQLGVQAPSFQVNSTPYQAPNLESYLTGNNAPINVGGQNAQDYGTSPYLAALLGKNKLAASA